MIEDYLEQDTLNDKVTTIVNVSGGLECFAALWWAKERGLNAVGLHLYNNPHKTLGKEAELYYAKKQCEFFKFPLVVDVNTIPQKFPLRYPVNQHISAAISLILGHPDNKWEYLVWGANADDSFAQRLQLRYPMRAIFAQKSAQLDIHGVSAGTILQAPINIFPFETLQKSEVMAMLAKNIFKKDVYPSTGIWYCLSDKVEKTEEGYKPCGKCEKCIEWQSSVDIANRSWFKQQEGTFRKKLPEQEWIE